MFQGFGVRHRLCRIRFCEVSGVLACTAIVRTRTRPALGLLRHRHKAGTSPEAPKAPRGQHFGYTGFVWDIRS